jgi:hypothetical protein
MTPTPTCSTAPSDPFSHPNGCLRSYGRFRVVGSAPSGRARRRVRGGTLQRRGCPEREAARAENAAGLAGCRARLLSRRGDGEFRHFFARRFGDRGDGQSQPADATRETRCSRCRRGTPPASARPPLRSRWQRCAAPLPKRSAETDARDQIPPAPFRAFRGRRRVPSRSVRFIFLRAAPRLTRTRDPFVSSRTLPCAGAHGASPRRGAPEVLPQRQASRLALPAVCG